MFIFLIQSSSDQQLNSKHIIYVYIVTTVTTLQHTQNSPICGVEISLTVQIRSLISLTHSVICNLKREHSE